MKHSCPNCSAEFVITDEDLAYYESLGIGSPTWCPHCRWQRRLTWRNDRALYHRTCDGTGKKIISIFSEDKPFPVYENDYWWSDAWDACAYGRDFDFSRPFFEQFNELQSVVPHPALAVLKPTLENSDYCNQVGFLKNCYLIFDSRRSEQCMYGKTMERCFDCVDCFKVFDCESCYEANSCQSCQFSTYIFNSSNCSDCHFVRDCVGCKNCFLCVNQQNKSYCLRNEQLSKEEWERAVAELRRQKSPAELVEELEQLGAQLPVKYMHERNTTNCTGDYLVDSSNCTACYDCEYLEDSKYCYDLKKDDAISARVYDFTHFGGNVEECCECVNCGNVISRLFVCDNVWASNDVYYSRYCKNSKYLFGCIGTHRKEYCIFNKQYSPEEYEQLKARIIEHMKNTEEWGEFFPTDTSPYAYDETVAQEYFPMLQDAVLARGWQWKDHQENLQYDRVIDAAQLPLSIDAIPDDVLNWAIRCSATGKLFKITKQELGFYRKMHIALPKLHPNERHKKRLVAKNPRTLWDRTCAKCSKAIQTTYSPERLETVVCEECYLKEVY